MSTTEWGSSLKNFPFKGWTADQILEKYESVLASREKQITDLSIEMGSINDKINTLTDQVEQYKKENQILKESLTKKDEILKQELNNKEIMFIRLEKREKQIDELKKKYDLLLKNYPQQNLPKKEEFNNPYIPTTGTNINKSEPYLPPQISATKAQITNEIKKEEKGKDDKDNNEQTHNNPTEKEKQKKSSARVSHVMLYYLYQQDKLNELKSKNQNLTKINFSQLLQKKEEENKKEQPKKEEEPKKEEPKKDEESKKEEEKENPKEELKPLDDKIKESPQAEDNKSNEEVKKE